MMMNPMMMMHMNPMMSNPMMSGCFGKGCGKFGDWTEKKPGDWICASCGDHQFAKNKECRKCGAKRGSQEMVGVKPGDWICPACQDLQFAKNATCRQCGAPNPDPAGSTQAMEEGKAAGTGGPVEKPGDWYCPGCGDLQFARNDQCRKCGTPNPSPKGAGKGKPEMKPGDWHCSACGDLQFARNMQCRKCGAPNYGAIMMSMQGPAMMKGFMGKGAMAAPKPILANAKPSVAPWKKDALKTAPRVQSMGVTGVRKTFPVKKAAAKSFAARR